MREEWKTAVKTGAMLDTEFRLREGSGAYRWFKTRGIPIRDTRGAVLKWYCTCTDVDHLKQATAGLTGVIEELDDACIVLNGGLAIAYLNTAAEGLLGHKRQEVLGKPFTSSLLGTGDSGLAARLLEIMREGHAVSIQARMGHAQRKAMYALRVLPCAGGLSIVCRRAPETAEVPAHVPAPGGGAES